MRPSSRDPLLLAAAKLAVSGAVLASGFRAVSDDDFARVVLAQCWAETPVLDPTGTSWLPLPFWFYGSAMTLFGRTLFVAQATAVVLGVLAVLLLYAAGRMWWPKRRDALWGAMICAVLPWSAYLGVATVPELPTAALTVFGVATLASTDARHRVLGGLALSAACLCRYEPWPATALFGLVCAVDAWRDERPAWLLAAAIAAVGPSGWLLHNALAHGDPLHFAARVSAYKRALGGTGSFFTYLSSLCREEPELVMLAIFVAGHRSRFGPASPASRRVALVLGGMLVALSLASLPGSAPTHHSGRAVLAVWLAMAIYVAPSLRAWLSSPRGRLVGLALAALVALGAVVLRPWYARLDRFTPRVDEVAIGDAARTAPAPVLLEVRDYRFYAIEAGSADPRRFVRERSIDPRQAIPPNAFDTPQALRRRMEETGAKAVVGTVATTAPVLGEPVAEAGPWGLFILTE